jgi:predicted amidohydrolase YtcJ
MKSNFKHYLLLSALLFTQSISAQTIYTNGKIVTVDGKNTIAEAIYVKNGKIEDVGTSKKIAQYKKTGTTVIDLKGKTVLPGFIDGHSHFMSFNRYTAVDLNPAPVGDVKNIQDIVDRIATFKKNRNVQPGEWINGFGYDQDQLEEKRHPTKFDLDKAFPDNPITITHISGHMSVSNSLALKLSGIDANTPNPAGGVIERVKNSNEPTGLLQEKAKGLIKPKGKKAPSLDEKLELLKEQQSYYASRGITTAQDGFSTFDAVEFLAEAAKLGKLFIDIEVLPGFPTLPKILKNPDLKFGVLNNHLKLAGTKISADGSPQGKTAFFTKAYLVEVPGCNHENCAGFPTVTQEQFNQSVLFAFKNNIRTFAHCNGDATIDMYLTAIKNANTSLNTESNSRRPVTIHSQFVRNDQLDEYKRLGVIPAFFTNHAYFWGDVHTRNLGAERANFLSPLKTAASKGIIATNHTDFPVTPINQLFLLWTSLARESRSGKVIGADERVSLYEGLKAITINGAYQYNEEKIKGSIEKGKLADLVIIAEDITKIPVGKIKDLEVLETIKEGKTVYKKP